MSSRHSGHSVSEWRHIRLVTSSDADYAARCAILQASDPATTIDKLKYSDSLWEPKFQRKRFLAEVDGVAVATAMYAEWVHWYEPGRYIVNIYVHPDYRRQGHGAALYDVVREYLASETPAGRLFMCHVHESEPDAVRFVTQRGFQPSGVDQPSELDVTAFDSQRAVQAVSRMREQGIEIVSYPELVKSDPDFFRKWYELACLSTKDMPAGGERTYQPFEILVRQVFEHPGFLPEIFFVAIEPLLWLPQPQQHIMDKGRYVGLSDLVNEKEDREHLGTGYTGVHPDYRRRGIATALKLCCIQAAKEQGAKTISTGNWHTNPMYQLNLQLGFKPLPAELWYELKLE